MRDSNAANAAKESAQPEFPHGLLDFCTAVMAASSFCLATISSSRHFSLAAQCDHFADPLLLCFMHGTLDQTTAPPALGFAPQCRRRVPLRSLRERDGLIVSDPVSKNAARAMTTAVSKPMADKKITALAGSDIAICLSGRLFPSFTAGESRHDRRFAHSRFASTPIAALVPAIRLVRRDLHAQCPLLLCASGRKQPLRE
jgi:hypothetical protein